MLLMIPCIHRKKIHFYEYCLLHVYTDKLNTHICGGNVNNSLYNKFFKLFF